MWSMVFVSKFSSWQDVGGVDAAVEFGFSSTGYEGDMTVIGTRGFDEFFLDFNMTELSRASLMPLAKLPQPEPTSTIEHPAPSA